MVLYENTLNFNWFIVLGSLYGSQHKTNWIKIVVEVSFIHMSESIHILFIIILFTNTLQSGTEEKNLDIGWRRTLQLNNHGSKPGNQLQTNFVKIYIVFASILFTLPIAPFFKITLFSNQVVYNVLFQKLFQSSEPYFSVHKKDSTIYVKMKHCQI